MTDIEQAMGLARQAAYRAVGLTGSETAACNRYANALDAALISLRNNGWNLVPASGVQLTLTADEAERFCTDIGGVDTLWGTPPSAAASAAMTVRGALDKRDATRPMRSPRVGPR